MDAPSMGYLLEQMLAVAGRLPADTRYILKLMTHPDIVEHAQVYFNKFNYDTRCLRYSPPWSCRLESEAKYENIIHGWTGVEGGRTQDSWCVNCQKPSLLEDDYEGSEDEARDIALSEVEIARENKAALDILQGIYEE
jgi:hypothetical protein